VEPLLETIDDGAAGLDGQGEKLGGRSGQRQGSAMPVDLPGGDQHEIIGGPPAVRGEWSASGAEAEVLSCR
jgi:hypothetical protein